MESVRFLDIAATSAAVAATSGRKAKIELLAEALRRLGPGEIVAGAAYLAGELRQRQTGVGYASLRERPAPAVEATLSVAAVDTAIAEISTVSGAGSQARRKQLLGALFGAATEAEQALLIGLFSGELRQGAQAGLLAEAIAAAAAVPAATVRRALLLAGDLKLVAEAALTGGAPALAQIHLRVGTPLSPMLASSAPDVAAALLATGSPAVVDTKLDGIRIQVHRSGDDVAVYTRSLDDITARLPEVVAQVRALPVREAILDGEAMLLDESGRPRPFQETSSRAATRVAARPRAKPWAAAGADVPAAAGRAAAAAEGPAGVDRASAGADGLTGVDRAPAGADGLTGVGRAAAGADGPAAAGRVAPAAEGPAGVDRAAAGADGLAGVGRAAAGAEGLAGVGRAAAGADGLAGVGRAVAGADGSVGVDRGAAGAGGPDAADRGAALAEGDGVSATGPGAPAVDAGAADAHDVTAGGGVSRGGREGGGSASGLRPYFFDLLHLDGVDLLDEPGRIRWDALAQAVPADLLVGRSVAETEEQAAAAFAAALAAGQEGVVIKNPEAPYDVGRRGAAWVKVKPRHTLDLVVLAVEWGHGRRRGWLSNLHLGARDPQTGGFVMLGKTFKGLTDELLRWQTERFQQLALADNGWVVTVRPEQVVEIAFDGVQTSPRYPGGVALRFARVLRYRDDKSADEADTIDTVRSIGGGHPSPPPA
ncbi:ATP-dependent DNA ligase [Actinoplanes subglobosus]|uniref:DNA ligase (ATP) n=1 Tax=Actinoplanes subglobosus TaxID=1547892 RepID=A0ABV8JB76_9ACTN